MGRRTWILMGVLALGSSLASCGEYQLGWAPPLLMNTAGLSQQVELDPQPLSFEVDRRSAFSSARPFTGHFFGTTAGSTVSMRVRADASDAAPAVALYGPRAYNGLFGAPIEFNLPKKGVSAVLWDVVLNFEGDYLILAKDAAGALGDYTVQVGCSGCGVPRCAPTTCGEYCATGFVRNAAGCLLGCECNPGCESEDDCPSGYLCDQGVCRKDTCNCSDPYQPVCGQDGNTYANTCEMQCAGVALDHDGACRPSTCAANADCPAGMLCANGVCVPACDCSGEPYDPVCGTDRVTYFNDCELQCAGVGIDHRGECESCQPEICDGRDNDCDGQVDEGCPPTCQSDADCPGGMACVNGQCVQVACDGDGDGFCPADGDCDDADAAVHPGAVEACDLADNDCDGQTDEGCPVPCLSDADCAAGQSCCGGDCVDLESNTSHCGGCGFSCQAGETCRAGACFPDGTCQSDADCDDSDPGTVDSCVNGTCVHRDACGTDADCPAGQVCWQGECRISCRTDPECPQGETCQGGLCAP